MKEITKIIHGLISDFGILIKKKILILPIVQTPYVQAVKSKVGFWYAGNLYDSGDIAYGIAANGLVEQEETILVQRILKQLPSDYTLLDIGANTGYYGIMSAYMYPSSQTYSFEPIKHHCDLITESAYLNRLSNIDINQYALGETTEEKEIYTVGTGTTLIKEFAANTNSKVMISIKKLDDVIKEKNITNVQFIKIDVEGFEFEVLRGSKEFLATSKPILFVEICHTKDGRDGIFKNENFYKTIELVEESGYVTYILRGANLEVFDKNTPPEKGVWMFLFIHAENHKHIVL